MDNRSSTMRRPLLFLHQRPGILVNSPGLQVSWSYLVNTLWYLPVPAWFVSHPSSPLVKDFSSILFYLHVLT